MQFVKEFFRKTNTCPLNITLLHSFLYRLTIRGMEILFLQKKFNLYANLSRTKWEYNIQKNTFKLWTSPDK